MLDFRYVPRKDLLGENSCSLLLESQMRFFRTPCPALLRNLILDVKKSRWIRNWVTQRSSQARNPALYDARSTPDLIAEIVKRNYTSC